MIDHFLSIFYMLYEEINCMTDLKLYGIAKDLYLIGFIRRTREKTL